VKEKAKEKEERPELLMGQVGKMAKEGGQKGHLSEKKKKQGMRPKSRVEVLKKDKKKKKTGGEEKAKD